VPAEAADNQIIIRKAAAELEALGVNIHVIGIRSLSMRRIWSSPMIN